LTSTGVAEKRFLTFVIVFLGMGSLLLGMWGGLARLGWNFPLLPGYIFLWHGPLMITGFLSTLIGLERAVAYSRLPAYAIPLLTGAGTLSILAGFPLKSSILMVCLGSLGLLGLSVLPFRRQPSLFTFHFLLGAFALLLGNILWLTGYSLFLISFYWSVFLTLTIVAERQELARILKPSHISRLMILAATFLVSVGLLFLPYWYKVGVQLLGGGMLLFSLWLLLRDPIRLNLKREGLPRYISITLLSGYIWLTVAGTLALAFGGATSGPLYDAILHSLFLGFVFSMIFGHMPIIFPALLNLSLSFSSLLYIPVALLHLSLILRIFGDLMFVIPARLWGGLLNAVAILFFFVVIVLQAASRPARPESKELSPHG